MQDYQQRVVDEKIALDDKITKLEAFLAKKPVVSKDDQIRLPDQLGHMRAYSGVLGQRIAAFA